MLGFPMGTLQKIIFSISMISFSSFYRMFPAAQTQRPRRRMTRAVPAKPAQSRLATSNSGKHHQQKTAFDTGWW